LEDHSPSNAVLRQAEAEGIDLDALRKDDPQKYRMLNSVPVADIATNLLEQVAEKLHKVFSELEIFQIPGNSAKVTRLFSFPAADADKVDDALASIAARHEDLFFRVIQDVRGERRELHRAIEPSAWQGIEGLVGPFANQMTADQWGANYPQKVGLETDVFRLRGFWFCDVFLVSET
jgi:hypothetical protein